MAHLSKRMRTIREKLTPNKVYALDEALTLLQAFPKTKFRESLDLSINLGIDTRKSDQIVRGAVVLPKGTGRTVRVAVITSSGHIDEALKAGADLAGLEDLAEQIKAGEINFDVLIATPDAMRVVGQLGQLLGPRGLMPNPKDGTVTNDLTNAIKNAKSGQVRYRADKAGIVHCSIGKLDFKAADIVENLTALLQAVKKARPTTAKGIYFKKVTLSSTMGPGLRIDVSSLVA